MNNDTLLMVDGTSKQVAPKNGTDYSLDELQGFVDGLIEIVSSPNGEQIMVLNEEGLLLDLEINHEASMLYHECGYRDGLIVGNVLVTASEKVK